MTTGHNFYDLNSNMPVNSLEYTSLSGDSNIDWLAGQEGIWQEINEEKETY